MKKILNIFASISLITAGASNVVACRSKHNPNPPTPTPPKSEIQKLYNQLDGEKTINCVNHFFRLIKSDQTT